MGTITEPSVKNLWRKQVLGSVVGRILSLGRKRNRGREKISPEEAEDLHGM